jgi:hypothetical protein
MVALSTCLSLKPAVGAPVACVGPDLDAAKTAQADASGTLQSVLNFLGSGDDDTKELVRKWFGSANQETLSKVSGVFSRASQYVSNLQFYCLYENDGSLVTSVQAPDGTLTVKDMSGALLGYVYPADMTTVNSFRSLGVGRHIDLCVFHFPLCFVSHPNAAFVSAPSTPSKPHECHERLSDAL